MMTDNRLQRRISDWELPEELNQDLTQWPAEGLQEQPDTQDLRTTLQLERNALFTTARLEERLVELRWEGLSPAQEGWYGEY